MASKAPPVTPLKRTAIFVSNLQRSLEFYQGVLGMNIWVQGNATAELPAIFTLIGLPPGKLRWVILQSEDVAWGMVGLFEIEKKHAGRTRRSKPGRANIGEACLVFHTPVVDQIHRAAKRMRLKVLSKPTTLVLKQHNVASREMTLRDPNGVMINFIQNMQGGSLGLSNRFPGIRTHRI